jgi:anti-anti-sigma factor
MSLSDVFRIETEGDTLIVIALDSVSTLAGPDVRTELAEMLEKLRGAELKNVVVDLAAADYFGTRMLEVMHVFWKHVHQSGGKLAVCNLSDVGRQVLEVSKLDAVWPVCSSRQEALQAVASE